MKRTTIVRRASPSAPWRTSAGRWLMLHGFLDARRWLLVAWRARPARPRGVAVRRGHRAGRPVLLAGCGAPWWRRRWYGWNLNRSSTTSPASTTRCSRPRGAAAPQGAHQGGQHPADGGRQPPPAGGEADRRRAARGRRVGPRRLPQRHDDGRAHPRRPEGGVRRVGAARLLRPDLRRRGRPARARTRSTRRSPSTGRSAPGAPSRTSAACASTTWRSSTSPGSTT